MSSRRDIEGKEQMKSQGHQVNIEERKKCSGLDRVAVYALSSREMRWTKIIKLERYSSPTA